MATAIKGVRVAPVGPALNPEVIPGGGAEYGERTFTTIQQSLSRVAASVNQSVAYVLQQVWNQAMNEQFAPYALAPTDTDVLIIGGSGSVSLPSLTSVIFGQVFCVTNATSGTAFPLVTQAGDGIFGVASSTPSVTLNSVGSGQNMSAICVADTVNRLWSVRLLGGLGGSLSSPLTTKGDLWGYSTLNARVPLSGSNGYVLTEDNTQALGVKWAASGAYSPNLMFGTINYQAVNYQMLPTDFAVFVSAGATITLPAASVGPAGYAVFIRNNDTGNTSHMIAHGGDSLDGVTGNVALQPPASSSAFVGAFCITNGVSRWSVNFTGG